MNSREVAASVLLLVWSGKKKSDSPHVYEFDMKVLLKGAVFKSSLISFVLRWV